jgi:hypothetical protein
MQFGTTPGTAVAVTLRRPKTSTGTTRSGIARTRRTRTATYPVQYDRSAEDEADPPAVGGAHCCLRDRGLRRGNLGTADFAGRTTTCAYGRQRRLWPHLPKPAGNVSFTYTAGRRTASTPQHHELRYDLRDRLKTSYRTAAPSATITTTGAYEAHSNIAARAWSTRPSTP